MEHLPGESDRGSEDQGVAVVTCCVESEGVLHTPHAHPPLFSSRNPHLQSCIVVLQGLFSHAKDQGNISGPSHTSCQDKEPARAL